MRTRIVLSALTRRLHAADPVNGTTMARRAAWCAAAAVCLAAAMPGAQGGPPRGESPPQSTFATGTQRVRVDVYAMYEGQHVEDLRAEEFTLLEDGVPQTVDQFERIAFRARGAAAPAADAGEVSWQAVADPRARVFVLFLDWWQQASPVPLLRQVERALSPDDVVAVMTPDMRPQDLAFSRDLRLLETFAARAAAGLDDETARGYRECGTAGDTVADGMIARRREKLTLDALDDLATFLGTRREAQTAVLLVSDGWRLYTPDAQILGGSGGVPAGGRAPEARPGEDVERGALRAPETAASCRAAWSALGSVNHGDRLREIAGRATRNNVVIHVASPSGPMAPALPGNAGDEAPYVHDNPAAMQAALRALADGTGGRVLLDEGELGAGLDRIMAESAAYYLLGYTSTNPRLDGTYRRIAVRVNRRGVDVRTRPGYFAAAVARASEGGAIRASGIDPVGAAFDRVAAAGARASIRIRESAWTSTPVGGDGAPGGAFWLVAELDPQVRRTGAWTRGGRAALTVVAPDGETVFSGTANLAAAGPAIEARVPASGYLAPGEYVVRVRMQPTDPVAQLSETLRVTIPSAPEPPGDAVLWRQASPAVPPVRTADIRFRRNERVRLEFAAATTGPATARLLDRAGAPLPVPVIVAERTDPAETERWIVVDVALTPLATGDYAVEVTHDGAVRVTAFRVVP